MVVSMFSTFLTTSSSHRRSFSFLPLLVSSFGEVKYTDISSFFTAPKCSKCYNYLSYGLIFLSFNVGDLLLEGSNLLQQLRLGLLQTFQLSAQFTLLKHRQSVSLTVSQSVKQINLSISQSVYEPITNKPISSWANYQ